LLLSLNFKQATIVLCENINIFLKKAIKQDIKDSILPMILDCFESKNVQIQVSIL